MRKLILLLAISFFCVSMLSAQNAFMGMKYQAVARDVKGEILPNAKIELKINLHSIKDGQVVSWYTETHSAVTNQVGLFTLVFFSP